MTQGLFELQPDQLTVQLERVLLPRLAEHLRSRAAGHCMRVSDLDTELMVRLCARLRAEVPAAEVVILGNGVGSATPAALTVTSTKLVELRNPLPDGSLRPPLLAFIPNNLRAAAEDSFGVSTFEDYPLRNVYQAAAEQALAELPAELRGIVGEMLRQLTHSNPWPFADPVAVVRYLLTILTNGADAEAVGASLYELGLIPDFELLADPSTTLPRLARNRECVSRLTWSAKSERGRVLDLELADTAYAARLGAFLAATGLEDPRVWTRRIVHDRSAWGYAFNHWTFLKGDEYPDKICIHQVEVKLPVLKVDQADERTSQLVGQQILTLGPHGLRNFSVTFHVKPTPSRVQFLKKFVLQVISRERGPVGLTRSTAAWSTDRDYGTVSFSKLNKVEWEEGWHYVRVLAQTESGDPVPLVDLHDQPLAWTADEEALAALPNHSEPFYVLPDGDLDIDRDQRAVPQDPSLAHALVRIQFTVLNDKRDPVEVKATEVEWLQHKGRGRPPLNETIQVKFGREGRVHVPVARSLREIEQRILDAPDGPVNWRVQIDQGEVKPAAALTTDWPAGDLAATFLEARRSYFAALSQEPVGLISQGVDFRGLRSQIAEYANAYAALVRDLLRRSEAPDPIQAQAALSDLRKVLALDTVLLAIRDFRDRSRQAMLIAPTHPLRALWLATWAELADHWLDLARDAPDNYAVPARDALTRLLTPIGLPPVLTTGQGHLLTTVDNIHPFWTLYAPSDEMDPRGLLGEVCTALSLPEPAIGGAAIDGPYLASRVQRYLMQHPYVSTLVVNAFNVGRAAILGDTLKQLQRDFPDLRYDIRLFVPDPDAPGVGEDLARLLSEVDEFASRTGDPLRPKLAISVRSLREFRAAPEHHTAHLSLLLDLFPAEQVGVARGEEEASAPVHGLVQEFRTTYHENETTVLWQRQPLHGPAQAFPNAEDLTQLLAALPRLLSTAAAAVATGETGMALRPVVKLSLDAEERALLHQVHEISDWVLILDRNMGIEFFDHGRQVQRPDYLIDHSPDSATALGHRLVITSRSVEEIQAIIQPVLAQHGLPAEHRHAVAALDQLRSLSGRLAFKLISPSTQRTEALGLALARMYLDHQGVFANQVVVPLDAHLDLYRARRRQAEEMGEEISLKRTDLAMFDLDATSRTITCRLVEVKCYTQVGDLGQYEQLKTRIADQIQQSEDTLRFHFDPEMARFDRPDRLVKTRELATLLGFYLDRSLRYGIVAPEAANEARFFLRTLEDGYHLQFTRSGLIFDFAKPGAEHADYDAGIEYHRIGNNLIHELIDAVAQVSAEPAAVEPVPDEFAPLPAFARTDIELRQRRERTPSVPTLDKAAFLSAPRRRTATWDELRAKHKLDEWKAEAQDQVTVDVDSQPASGTAGASASSNQLAAAAGCEPDAAQPLSPAVPSAGAEDAISQPSGLSGRPQASEADEHAPAYNLMLGVTGASPQYGILGEAAGRTVALDLNQTHTISLFGVQGGGKSYTLGTVAEMASLAIPGINQLPRPLATVIFHYSPTMDYRPEFTSMVAPNSNAEQVSALAARYGAHPAGLSDMLLLVPADKLAERRAEYAGIEVQPLKFASAELKPGHWRFLMGAVGNQALYLRQLNRVMKGLRNELTIDGIRRGIATAGLPEHLRNLAQDRLNLAADYIDDRANLSALVQPGRLIIVDLRDEFIEKDEALGLFVVVLQLVADATYQGSTFNKLVVFDEAHKYIESPDLIDGLIEVVREMRHKGTSVMIASQDPPSVPVALIELSSQIILHKFNSPAWLKHIQKANTALGELTAEKMSQLHPGEAYVWSSKATDDAFVRGAVKIRCRPRVTQHGGETKTAVTT